MSYDGDPFDALAVKLKNTPLWVFHGDADRLGAEFTLCHADGSLRVLDVVASPMTLAGRATYVVLQWRDVGEQRRAGPEAGPRSH